MKLFKKRDKSIIQPKTVASDDWIKVGTEYGGWFIPSNFINENSICYCVGAGEDVSFDLGLINKYNCKVVTIDPTPRSIRHCQKIVENTNNGISTPIISGNISEVYYKLNKEILNKWLVLPYGVWIENTIQKFYVPQNPKHISHSIVNLQKTEEFFEAECKTIKSIIEELGHSKIDLLKMDVEGVEHDVVRSIFKDKIYPRILLLEFDQPCSSEKINETINLIINQGYNYVKLDGPNAGFIKIKG